MSYFECIVNNPIDHNVPRICFKKFHRQQLLNRILQLVMTPDFQLCGAQNTCTFVVHNCGIFRHSYSFNFQCSSFFFSDKYERSLYRSLIADWWIQKQNPAPIQSQSGPGSRCRFSTIQFDDPFHAHMGTMPSQLFGLSCVYVWVCECVCQAGGALLQCRALSDTSPVEQEVCGEWIEVDTQTGASLQAQYTDTVCDTQSIT